jgi:hypothetical protein
VVVVVGLGLLGPGPCCWGRRRGLLRRWQLLLPTGPLTLTPRLPRSPSRAAGMHAVRLGAVPAEPPARPPLLQMMHAMAETPHQQVTVLSQVLASEVNIGYEDIINMQVGGGWWGWGVGVAAGGALRKPAWHCWARAFAVEDSRRGWRSVQQRRRPRGIVCRGGCGDAQANQTL